VDLATMTGNVAQVFLTDEEWGSVLQSAHAALRPGGQFSVAEELMANQEKGLDRGGGLGQEGELGEETKDLGGEQRERGPERRSQQRATPERRGQLRGGLQREPDLEGAEKETGHEVD